MERCEPNFIRGIRGSFFVLLVPLCGYNSSIGGDDRKSPLLHGEMNTKGILALTRKLVHRGEPHDVSYLLTRRILLQSLGFIYVIAFLSLLLHLRPLLSSEGLLPACRFVEDLKSAGSADAFWQRPTLFWFNCSDAILFFFACLGLGLSALLMAGFANVLQVILIWVIYMSFVHIGQIFYGYGWEILLLETTFLSIFLCPATRLRLSNAPLPPSVVILWFYRWLVFRVMFGAGLIKIRHDLCWMDLTCLVYHYETQPIPNPFSWYLHHAPLWFHKVGVLWNHFVELVVPFFVFGPRLLRVAGGVLFLSFQTMLILSGNLSWLNWLTIVIAISCFDDRVFRALIPRRYRKPMTNENTALPGTMSMGRGARAHRVVIIFVAVFLLYLSRHPVQNMLMPGQRMNYSYDSLHLMSTYGAFGTIGRNRFEIILEGTDDEVARSETVWKAYEFPGKPGDVHRSPAFIAPFHYRLDWQIWFAAMQTPEQNPWLLHLIYKLLEGNRGLEPLLTENPFPEAPPTFIRAQLYQYTFSEGDQHPEAWWNREYQGEYLPRFSLDSPGLVEYLEAVGLLE